MRVYFYYLIVFSLCFQINCCCDNKEQNGNNDLNELKVQWKIDFREQVSQINPIDTYHSPPLLVGRIIYVINGNAIFSVNTDGTVNWSYFKIEDDELKGIYQGRPAYFNNKLYAIRFKGFVEVFNAETGELIQSSEHYEDKIDGLDQIKFTTFSNTMIFSNIFYFCGTGHVIDYQPGETPTNSYILGIDTETLEIVKKFTIWTYENKMATSTANLNTFNNKIIAAYRTNGSATPDVSGGALAFDIGTGEVVWNIAYDPGPDKYNDKSCYDDPILYNGILYTTTWQGYAHAIDAETGEKLWTNPWSTSTSMRGCSVGDGRMYASTIGDKRLAALDLVSGKTLWHKSRADLPGSVTCAPFFYNGVVYLFDQGMRVYDPETGELLVQLGDSGGSNSAPVTNGELLFWKDGGTNLYAFTLVK